MSRCWIQRLLLSSPCSSSRFALVPLSPSPRPHTSLYSTTCCPQGLMNVSIMKRTSNDLCVYIESESVASSTSIANLKLGLMVAMVRDAREFFANRCSEKPRTHHPYRGLSLESDSLSRASLSCGSRTLRMGTFSTGMERAKGSQANVNQQSLTPRRVLQP